MERALKFFSFTLLFFIFASPFVRYLYRTTGHTSAMIGTLYLPGTEVSHRVRPPPECLTVNRSEPVKVEPAPGRDKILGSLITHVVRPECRETLTLLESDPEILVSVKTTSQNHKHRLSLQLFTWMETVSPQQLYLITDKGADDVWIKEAEHSGINVVQVDCPSGHNRESLCCRSGAEHEQFYTATSNGKTYRWFCHFDDDEYLNIGTLSTQLRKYNSSRKYYLGHSPSQVEGRLAIFKQFPEAKRKNISYATGASYCVSAALMRDVEKYFRGSERFASTCRKIGLTDDLAIGAILGLMLGVNVTEVSTMKSQLNDFTKLSTTSLTNMITISSKLHDNNRINISGSPFNRTEDPTGFFSYHCLLYPQTTWCWNKEIHVYQ